MKFPIIRQSIKHPLVEETVEKAKKWLKDRKGDPNSMFTHFCPYCGAPLEATDRREKLETLDEHVSCSEVSMKTVYKCSAHCGLSECSKWNSNGELYCDFPKGLSDEQYDVLYKLRQKAHKTCFGAKINEWPAEALGSLPYKIQMECETPNRRKEFPIKVFKNQKYVPVIIRTYEFDEFGKALKMVIRMDYRKYVDKNSYQIWIPWWVQVKRLIKNTYYDYRNWQKYPTDRNLKRLYGESGFRSRHEKQGFEKFWFEKIVPFIFGKGMGIVYKK